MALNISFILIRCNVPDDWQIYFGFTVLALAVARLIINWQYTAPPITPRPPSWQMLMTKEMKIYLYDLMRLALILGWLYLSANGESAYWFFIKMLAIYSVFESVAEFAKEAHELLGVSGYFFITIHGVAGLYHHYIVKDDTLRRILPRFITR